MNLLIFASSYLIILISVIGYSLFFYKIFKNNINLEFEFSLLGSLLFLIFLSLFTHLFIKHGYLHNLIVLLFGILSFFYISIKEKKLLNNYIYYICIIFLILFVALLTDKTHDDFPYYHFPYTYYLTQDKLIIGTGTFNHGFRTPSSIFYLNSLFYLPFIKYFSFHFGAILIMGFSNLILVLRIKDDFKKEKFDFLFVLTVLSFLFINVFFYRISEHGTDRSAQILIFILFIEILSLFRNQIILKKFFSKIFILLGLIISLKAFYVLYLLVLIPIFFQIKEKNFFRIFKDLLRNFYFCLFIFVGLFLIILNIFNSGCILYPVSFTCFSNLEWSLSNEAKIMNNWYELWSKAGASPTDRVENPESYIQGFNWLENWISLYFFTKISDFLAGISFLLLVVFLTFYPKKKKKTFIDKNIFWIYAIIILLFFEWFYNHPSLRYGGFALIALIIFIPFSILVAKFNFEKHLKIKIIFLLTISLTIFIGRNIDRISNEVKKYDYKPVSNTFYRVTSSDLRVDIFIKELKKKYENCKNKNECPAHEGISIFKKKNYYYLVKNK